MNNYPAFEPNNPPPPPPPPNNPYKGLSGGKGGSRPAFIALEACGDISLLDLGFIIFL